MASQLLASLHSHVTGPSSPPHFPAVTIPHMYVSQDFLSLEMGRVASGRPEVNISLYVPASCPSTTSTNSAIAAVPLF